MAISLSSLSAAQASSAFKMVLYGAGGIGKTTAANHFPSPVFARIERGAPVGEKINGWDIEKYDDMLDVIRLLGGGGHDFKTLVIDTIDGFEAMVYAQTCMENGWANIEEPGYGKGYAAADDIWMRFLKAVNWLRDKGISTVMLAHCEITQFSPPGSESYNRYELKLQKRGRSLIVGESDIIGFLHWQVSIKKVEAGFNKVETHAEGGGTRLVGFEERPAYVAKNRYDLPPVSVVPPARDGLYSLIAPKLPKN